MPWSGGTYSKWNNATGGWTGDQTNGIGIESGRHDSQDNDFTTGINSCLVKDGTNTPTADLNMGNYKHTNVANGSALNHYASLGQVQAGAFIWGGTSTGSANSQTISISPSPSAYAAGQCFRFVAGYTNTGAATLQVNSLGTKNVYGVDTGTNLGVGCIRAGTVHEVVYDGTNFILLNPSKAQSTFTPSIGQGSPVSMTVSQAEYSIDGPFVEVQVSVTATAAGAAAAITASVPVAMITAGGPVVGSARFYDVSPATSYVLSAVPFNSLNVQFINDASGGNYFGAAPAVTIASGDQLSYQLRYRWA